MALHFVFELALIYTLSVCSLFCAVRFYGDNRFATGYILGALLLSISLIYFSYSLPPMEISGLDICRVHDPILSFRPMPYTNISISRLSINFQGIPISTEPEKSWMHPIHSLFLLSDLHSQIHLVTLYIGIWFMILFSMKEVVIGVSIVSSVCFFLLQVLFQTVLYAVSFEVETVILSTSDFLQTIITLYPMISFSLFFSLIWSLQSMFLQSHLLFSEIILWVGACASALCPFPFFRVFIFFHLFLSLFRPIKSLITFYRQSEPNAAYTSENLFQLYLFGVNVVFSAIPLLSFIRQGLFVYILLFLYFPLYYLVLVKVFPRLAALFLSTTRFPFHYLLLIMSFWPFFCICSFLGILLESYFEMTISYVRTGIFCLYCFGHSLFASHCLVLWNDLMQLSNVPPPNSDEKDKVDFRPTLILSPHLRKFLRISYLHCLPFLLVLSPFVTNWPFWILGVYFTHVLDTPIHDTYPLYVLSLFHFTLNILLYHSIPYAVITALISLWNIEKLQI